MKKCYKCQAPYLEANSPGFQDVCEGCGSYLHCCQNCRFYDQYAHNSCLETQAEYVSDSHGMNRCEYFRFALPAGAVDEGEEDKGRRFRKPDWRNVNKNAGGGGSRSKPGMNSSAPRSKRPAENPFGGGGGPAGREDKAQKAREALDKLFKKDS